MSCLGEATQTDKDGQRRRMTLEKSIRSLRLLPVFDRLCGFIKSVTASATRRRSSTSRCRAHDYVRNGPSAIVALRRRDALASSRQSRTLSLHTLPDDRRRTRRSPSTTTQCPRSLSRTLIIQARRVARARSRRSAGRSITSSFTRAKRFWWRRPAIISRRG